MAKKGIRYFIAGKLNKTTGAYTDGKWFGPVAAFNGTPNSSDVKDYGDDHCVETASEVTGCALSVELNNDDLETQAYLLGHTLTDGELLVNADDEAPYVGCGAIGKSGSKWRAKFYLKGKFAEPNDENSTKQESTTFGHITLEGDFVTMDNGDWKKEKEFDTLEAAKAYLNNLVGIEATGVTGATGETS